MKIVTITVVVLAAITGSIPAYSQERGQLPVVPRPVPQLPTLQKSLREPGAVTRKEQVKAQAARCPEGRECAAAEPSPPITARPARPPAPIRDSIIKIEKTAVEKRRALEIQAGAPPIPPSTRIAGSRAPKPALAVPAAPTIPPLMQVFTVGPGSTLKPGSLFTVGPGTQLKPGAVSTVGPSSDLRPGSVTAFAFGPGTLIVPGGQLKPGGIADEVTAVQLPTSDEFMVTNDALTPDDPAYLAVGIRFGKDQICSGVLVGPRHVLTAAHCACSNMADYRIILDGDARPDNIGIRLAQPPIPFDPRACRQQIPGKDLGLLILATPFTCKYALVSRSDIQTPNGQQKQIAAVPLVADCRSLRAIQSPTSVASTYGYPTDLFAELRSILTTGRKLLVVGYGYIDDVNLGRRAQVPIPIKSAACTEPALAESCLAFAEMLLAEEPGPGIQNDACKGDSGGPVFLLEGGSYKLVAVTSRAGPGAHDNPVLHCGGAGIYTIIGRQSVFDWLEANGVPRARRVTIERTARN